jgi:hypothetical protein
MAFLHHRMWLLPRLARGLRAGAAALLPVGVRRFAAALAAAFFAVQPSASRATVALPPPPAVVGEATLVIGQARIVGADGSSRDAQRGAEVRVGDRIETRQGAHLHVRFVDGGRVSVRPASRLVIEQYAPPDPAGVAGAIKFRLEEGVVRSITGAWGEAARERFRLNTPVAAIGVKGTDFVVRSTGEGTAASVYAGAIVLSPLTEACLGTVGPCLSGVEKLLSADMKGQMLELHRQRPVPQLVPAIDLMALAQARPAPANGEPRPAAAPVQARLSVGSGEVKVAIATGPDGRGSGSVAPVAAAPSTSASVSVVAAGPSAVDVRFELSGGRADRAALSETVRIEVSSDKPVVAENLAVATLAAASTAAANVVAQAAKVAAEAAAKLAADAAVKAAAEAAAQAAARAAAEAAAALAAEILARRNAPEQDLFWLRYPWSAILQDDDFSRRFDAALLVGTRSLGNNFSFSLRRPEGTIFAPEDATASFRLTGAAARVSRDGGLSSETVRITDGSLAVDFARATFSSSLTAVGPILGTSQAQAIGTIDAVGAMQSTAGNAVMAGGFNGDGRKAGLSFYREVPGGVLQGISQWTR